MGSSFTSSRRGSRFFLIHEAAVATERLAPLCSSAAPLPVWSLGTNNKTHGNLPAAGPSGPDIRCLRPPRAPRPPGAVCEEARTAAVAGPCLSQAPSPQQHPHTPSPVPFLPPPPPTLRGSRGREGDKCRSWCAAWSASLCTPNVTELCPTQPSSVQMQKARRTSPAAAQVGGQPGHRPGAGTCFPGGSC